MIIKEDISMKKTKILTAVILTLALCLTAFAESSLTPFIDAAERRTT